MEFASGCDMLSPFVKKDAKNWDKYVPYALMAYRSTPHCTVNKDAKNWDKYVPYAVMAYRATPHCTVNKDAKNWDKYVPYALMAYRATPHCTIKYSQYYLVYGRDLRLPIEGDWRPKRQEEAGNKGDHDRHVSELAMRLCEANREARKLSKLSHEVAKRYYEKRTREVLLKRGDFVFLYNPLAKRGRAKNFFYYYYLRANLQST
jgi:hypothetical protein